MASYLVLTDLERDSSTRSGLLGEIRRFVSWEEITPTAFALQTDESAEEVYRKLKDRLGPEDILYVLTLHAGWFGRGPHEANEWLSKYVGG